MWGLRFGQIKRFYFGFNQSKSKGLEQSVNTVPQILRFQFSTAPPLIPCSKGLLLLYSETFHLPPPYVPENNRILCEQLSLSFSAYRWL